MGPLLVWVNAMRQSRLEQLVTPTVQAYGCTFVGVESLPQGRQWLFRVYIDKPEGVTLEDCETVSRRINAVLGVQTDFQGAYTLEVSSPGLDRVLFTPEQCREQLGKEVSIRLKAPIEGSRNYRGQLQGVEGNTITIMTKEGAFTFSFADVHQARLIPQW